MKQMNKLKEITAIIIFMACTSFGLAQTPSYDIYIINDTLTSFTTYEFDIMIRANGSTSSFNLRSFQAGLFINPAFTASNTIIGCSVVSGSSQMAGPGYNGSIQWNNTDKIVNMGFNTATTCAIPTVVTTTPLRIARIRLIGFLGFGCGAPDLRFNYVPMPLPLLRLRSEILIWNNACGSETFYPPTFGSTPTFNGEVWTQTDADGKSPVSPYDNNSPGIISHPASVFVCQMGTASFSVSAVAPSLPAGGTLTYQWQVNCGSGFTNIPSANAASYSFSPVTASNNGCQYRCVVSYSCGGSYTSNAATLTTLIATQSHTAVACFGGTSVVTIGAINGMPPYSGTGNFPQSAGTIIYTITDFNGCSASVSVTVTQPSALSVSCSSNSPVCAGTALNLSSVVSGGTTTYGYSWTGPSFSSATANPVIASATMANTGTYTVTVTDANGCSSSAATNANILNCTAMLNLKFFIEGYYIGGGMMSQVLFNEGVDPNPLSTNVDTVIVELHDTSVTSIVAQSFYGVLQQNGNLSCTFPGSVIGNAYWIAIKHRSALQTWSRLPIVFAPVNSYDFSTAANKAYNNNLKDIYSENIWSVYNGDINQDESVDIFDFPQMDNDIQNFNFGYYSTDLNGDGSVDIFDFPVLDNNIQSFVSSYHP
jgi:hypothetical protein